MHMWSCSISISECCMKLCECLVNLEFHSFVSTVLRFCESLISECWMWLFLMFREGDFVGAMYLMDLNFAIAVSKVYLMDLNVSWTRVCSWSVFNLISIWFGFRLPKRTITAGGRGTCCGNHKMFICQTIITAQARDAQPHKNIVWFSVCPRCESQIMARHTGSWRI